LTSLLLRLERCAERKDAASLNKVVVAGHLVVQGRRALELFLAGRGVEEEKRGGVARGAMDFSRPAVEARGRGEMAHHLLHRVDGGLLLQFWRVAERMIPASPSLSSCHQGGGGREQPCIILLGVVPKGRCLTAAIHGHEDGLATLELDSSGFSSSLTRGSSRISAR
jgi:hypothetical protein